MSWFIFAYSGPICLMMPRRPVLWLASLDKMPRMDGFADVLFVLSWRCRCKDGAAGSRHRCKRKAGLQWALNAQVEKKQLGVMHSIKGQTRWRQDSRLKSRSKIKAADGIAPFSQCAFNTIRILRCAVPPQRTTALPGACRSCLEVQE